MAKNDIDINNNVVSELETICKENGTNLTEACRKGKVNRSTVARWKKREPKTILEMRRILKAATDKSRK